MTFKTTFYLTDGTKLTDILPLESNGPNTTGYYAGPNKSTPTEILDIDYTEQSVTIQGDVTARFNPLIGNTFGGYVGSTKIVCGTQTEFDALIANGLTTGLYVDIPLVASETNSIVPNYTTISAVDKQQLSITLSSPLSATISARYIRFCYPFNIIDIDPQTASPYVGSYGASSCTFNGTTSTITLSKQTPLASATFDIARVTTGPNGLWTIVGCVDGTQTFYPQSTISVKDNGFAAANASYQVASVRQSGQYSITDVVINSSTTTLTVRGNAGDFFLVNPSAPYYQLTISGNTTHTAGTALNGAHDIVSVGAYNAIANSTTVTVNGAISGVSAPADGVVQPVLPVSIIEVTGQIINGTQPNGIVMAGTPMQLPFAAPPAITPTAAHNYIVSWRVANDVTSIIKAGDVITIKNNNYYKFKRLVVDSTSYGSGVTEIRTVVSDPSFTMPVIGTGGYLIYPAPAVPYGHLQYTVLIPSSSLQLVGKGVTHYNETTTWGQALQNNAIHTMENFASSVPPAAPLNGQLWFNSAEPSLSLRVNGQWENVLVAGTQISQDMSMNGHAIYGLGDLDLQAFGTSQALNVKSADLRYVNASGDSMTGTLSMSGHKITNVGDSDIPAGTQIDYSTPNGQDAINLRTGDARYVNVDGDTMIGALDMSQHHITNVATPSAPLDAANKTYVDSLSSGIVWLQPVEDPNLFDDSMSTPPVVSDTDVLFYRSYFVKPAQYAIVGVDGTNKTWHISSSVDPQIVVGDTITIINNPDAAGGYTVANVTSTGADYYITVTQSMPTQVVDTGVLQHAVGAWNGMDGRIAGWNNDTSRWVDVLERKAQVGDRFGVFFEADDTPSAVPGGSFAGGTPLAASASSAAGKIVTINSIDSAYVIDWGTAPNSLYPPHVPMEPDAASVLGANSEHFGHSYTFRGTWGAGQYSSDYKWIEFAGPSMIVDGAGLKYSGNVLNVGSGTGIAVGTNTVSVDVAWADSTYMRRDGLWPFDESISMGNNRLMNLHDPVDPQDALTLKYFNTYAISRSGDAMAGKLDMGGYQITGLPSTPASDSSATSKAYVDTKVSRAGDSMTGNLVMANVPGGASVDMSGTNRVVNLADAINPMDALNLQTADGRYVNVNGDTMVGPLTLSGDPTQPFHSTTKQYVDNLASSTVLTAQSMTIDGGSF